MAWRYNYIKYFGDLIKYNNLNNISSDQFLRAIETIFIQHHYIKLKCLLGYNDKDIDNYMRVWGAEKDLTKITGNLSPEELLNEMKLLSKN